jgi:spore coat polysaccharide biosynthesis protein SpsF
VRTVAILQARTTSTRLAGKVLADIEGRPLIVRELDRLSRATAVDDIVVATTTNESDDAVVDCAEQAGARWYRGPEHDVLARYVGAAREAAAEIVVRVTADCPLLDPGVVDRVVAALQPDVDYASNVLVRTFPVGLDVEVMFADVLYRVDRLGRSPEAREHVTWFVRSERPDLFVCRSVVDDEDNSDLRWTVDTDEDLAVVRQLYRELNLADTILPYREVVAHARGKSDRRHMRVG